jgi:hypothetical protein
MVRGFSSLHEDKRKRTINNDRDGSEKEKSEEEKITWG